MVQAVSHKPKILRFYHNIILSDFLPGRFNAFAPVCRFACAGRGIFALIPLPGRPHAKIRFPDRCVFSCREIGCPFQPCFGTDVDPFKKYISYAKSKISYLHMDKNKNIIKYRVTPSA